MAFQSICCSCLGVDVVDFDFLVLDLGADEEAAGVAFARFGRRAGGFATPSSCALRLFPLAYLEFGNFVPTSVGTLIFSSSSPASKPCLKLLWRISPDGSEKSSLHLNLLPLASTQRWMQLYRSRRLEIHARQRTEGDKWQGWLLTARI